MRLRDFTCPAGHTMRDALCPSCQDIECGQAMKKLHDGEKVCVCGFRGDTDHCWYCGRTLPTSVEQHRPDCDAHNMRGKCNCGELLEMHYKNRRPKPVKG